MTETNVALVKRMYELINAAYMAHEFPEQDAREILDPQVRLDASRNIFNPAVYDGIDGARRMFDGLWEVWDDFALNPHEVLGQGDKVAIRVEMRGRGRDGIEVAREVGNLLTFRDGRVVEMIGGMEWSEAVEALGREPT